MSLVRLKVQHYLCVQAFNHSMVILAPYSNISMLSLFKVIHHFLCLCPQLLEETTVTIVALSGISDT